MTHLLSSWKNKTLFTPGPLTTSQSVKQAMLTELGSRDYLFIDVIQTIRQQLLAIGRVAQPDYTTVLMQGSGTFGIESVISSTIAEAGHLLVISNGAYGQRIQKIAQVLKIKTTALECPENEIPALDQIEKILTQTPDITDVIVVHCETTTGLYNPVEEIGKLAKKHNKCFIVDAMSSFGAVPIDIAGWQIDFLISSANKCIEGVPGFSFVIANQTALEKAKDRARSLSFDLYAQWQGLEANGQFRFTPPTHALLAFRQALKELEEEGGVEGRMRRYQNNYRILLAGMRRLGFKEYLPPELQGWIITSFLFPQNPQFHFETFYQKLNDLDCVIYPGKVSNADCFRIGNIGRLFESDMRGLLWAIEHVCQEMGLDLTK